MELHQLKTFYYVANYLNFSKAAEKVSLSQPAVSRQIEALEGYFNLPLFTRSGRKVELTDAGRRLLQYTEQILLLSDEAERAVRSFNNLEEGEINVGAGTTVGNYLLSSLIVDFQDRYPNIKINLFIDKTHAIIEKIKKGELEIAVVAKSTNYPEFNYKALLSDEILLVGSPEYGTMISGISSLHQLVNETFLLRREGSNTRENTDYLFKVHHFNPKKIIEFDTNEAIKNAIMKGFGIGFISEMAIKNEIDLNLVVQFQLEQQCHRNFSLISSKGKYNSPIMLIFSSFLKKSVYKI